MEFEAEILSIFGENGLVNFGSLGFPNFRMRLTAKQRWMLLQISFETLLSQILGVLPVLYASKYVK